MKILIICTGNTCRSQMAEGYLKYRFPNWQIYSAGTEPGIEVNPLAVKAMREIGIDISNQYPKHVDQFIDMEFDFVLTVCDHAREVCPTFTGPVKHRLHRGFEDPALSTGTEQEKLKTYRKVRDQIIAWLDEIFKNE